MIISLYFFCFLIINYIGHGYGSIDITIDPESVDMWTKNPLVFSGFRGCGNALMSLSPSSVIIQIKNCGNVASSKLDKSYISSHMKFLWSKENPLGTEGPGQLEGSQHKIDGKGNTMEVQFYFYDKKHFDGFEHAAATNGVKIVSVFLQTDTRLVDNPKFERIMKYLQKISTYNREVRVRSGRLVPKVIRKKVDKKDSGPPRKVLGIFDLFYGAFNTGNKRVIRYTRDHWKIGKSEYRAEVFIIEEAIPVSPEQVYAFWKLLPDFDAPHVSESISDEFDIEVYAGPKY